MNINAGLIRTVAGEPNQVNLGHHNDTLTQQQRLQPHPPQPELNPQKPLPEQQEHGQHDLQFQKSPATAGSLQQLRQTASTASTMPPEIIQLIVNYLDNRHLVKVITLNWTWAHLAAPQLWRQIDYTVQSSRIYFLITKSVAPPSPDKAPSTNVFPPPVQPSGADILPLPDSMPRTRLSSSPSQAGTGFTSAPSNQFGEAVSEPRPPPLRRRRSYPWPTLLPYHTMVHTLKVKLSTADMVQDLLELIPCCTELQSFALESAIPTEDLLIRGVISSACNDALDPLNHASRSTTPHHHSMSSSSSASLTSLALGTQTCHTHSYSLRLDPYNRSMTPTAGLQEADNETIMASSTSQSGKLFKLLSQSCPKLEKIWFSGFHPVSVLGAPTDLRPRSTQEHRLSTPPAETLAFQPPVASEAPFQTTSSSMGATVLQSMSSATDPSLPPIPPVPGINAAVALPASTSPKIVAAANSHSHLQSKIHSVQFVNCNLPPQYLLTMIQHSLPNLTELSLTQCWQGNPLTGTFLSSVSKICPGLKELTLHATQNHRDSVTSENLLQLLQGLEGKPKEKDDGHFYHRFTGRRQPPAAGAGTSLADFPLGTFRKSSYTTTPSISSTAATIGSSSHASLSNSGSSSSSSSITGSSLSSLPSPSSTASSYLANGNITNQGSVSNSYLSAQASSYQEQQQNYDQGAHGSARPGSDLESISVWVTHSTFDQAIAAELANRARHPRLKRVEFGSEDAFDMGADLIRQLGEQRMELSVTWVNYGDTGDDRDD
ncbi:hypothetical protein BGZ96_002815 [Linnemannia gamsii]|uniref:F-box domain-containing protein n=1 Tax=Linnemannia gamsii TaxID=64522 RepID=A0ABQ7JK41_9FUNG|nr:hypothetical protein BGZ96_002815 [Linnemannia gamsii]